MSKPMRATLTCLLLLSSSAVAAPVTWYITGQFTDGGTISGSYAFDASSNAFSSVNITTTTGTAGPGYQYITPHPAMVQDATHVRVLNSTAGNLSTAHYLAINLSSAMSGSGGTVTAIPDSGSTYSEFACSDAGCGFTSQYRHLSAATVTTTAPVTPSVPTLTNVAMAAVALLLAGCALILLKRRPAPCA